MRNIKKSLCIVLVMVLLVVTVLSTAMINANAALIGYVNASDMAIRSAPTTQGSTVLKRVTYDYVTIHSSEVIGNYTWYYITYNGVTGYMRGDYMSVFDTSITDKSFEEQLKAFPESYHDALKALHSMYPNWQFMADNIPITFKYGVDLELGRKQEQYTQTSWRHMGQGSYDWATGNWIVDNGGWYFASREVIEYYMDPRNLLDVNYIYTFLHQAYSPALQTEDGVRNILKGTFMEKNYNDPNDTAYGGDYAKVIMAAAQKSGVSPYVLAATIIQEQGSGGGTALISGTYPGYVGYYNFFNIKASGPTTEAVIANGLAHAKASGWKTRSASIIGGAGSTLKNYLDRGQDTYYYMNYNVKNPANIHLQYAQAVHNAASSGNIISKTYANLKTATLNFKIPVFKDMPATKVAKPALENKLNNYYFNSITAEGLTPTFHRYTYNYDLRAEKDMIIKVEVPDGASYNADLTFALKTGDNTVKLGVKSETGYTYYYTVHVNATKDCTLYVDTGNGVVLPEPDPPTPPTEPDPPVTPDPPDETVMKGDASGDGKINGRDLANVQMHILGVKALTGNSLTGADTNGDGKINGRDLANIQMHILGVKLLT